MQGHAAPRPGSKKALEPPQLRGLPALDAGAAAQRGQALHSPLPQGLGAGVPSPGRALSSASWMFDVFSIPGEQQKSLKSVPGLGSVTDTGTWSEGEGEP